MSVIMNKELLIRMPAVLYKRTKKLCEKEYKSMSALIRELVMERLDETLSSSEARIVEKESKAFSEGKGKDLRKVKRI